MDSNNIKKDNDSKKITFILVAILVLMLTTTGGTYAFFALSANNASTVTGTASTASLTLNVAKIKPSSAGSGAMVPQLSYNASSNNKNILKLAVDANCLDGNNNVVCQVYTIVIQNKSSGGAKFNTTFTLSGGTYSNLKWYKLAEGTGSSPTTTYTYPSSITDKYGNAKTVTALGTTPSTIAKNGYYYYVVVVWIEETGTNQNSTDTGTFTGTVAVSAADANGNSIGGITSTITSS